LILDTDVLIEILRNRPNAVSWFSDLEEPPAISAIALLEVRFGARDVAELRRVEAFLRGQPVAWLEAEDPRLAATYATIRLSNGMGILDGVSSMP
jgi:predicted nucleic acid-binding protein